jgi:AcrR family transcriptional regulator
MIEAAERLVAERGLRSVSLREVQVAAGQRNKSAAQYHFGSLHGLVEAIVVARMAPVNARRLALLEGLDIEGRGHDVRALVEASITPFAEATLARRGSCYARFLVQVMADPAMSGLVAHDPQAEGLRIVNDRLVDALDQVPRPLRPSRIARIFGFVIVSVAGWEGRPAPTAPTWAVRVADLVDSCVAVLEAPPSTRTLEALAATDALATAAATSTSKNRPTSTRGA